MINKEITKMKKFTRIIAAVMAAATIAVTTSVCASARTLTTGQEITEELVNQYADFFKSCKINSDVLRLTSYELGFYATDDHGLLSAENHHEGGHVDYWATLQRSKVRQEKNAREGHGSFLDRWSRG